MKKTKKKAFTLTELLVVVIVIGVLAAVTLPSFNKVLETRKTTEAEDVLSALRTEQEYRCAMEKPYAADLNQLDTLASNTKKNFDYKISTEGSGSSAKVTGSEAVSKGKYNYTLRMPSYADGRMCCEGTDCGKLNKDYPLCSVLKARADYKQVPANCAPDADGLGDSGDVPHGDKCGEMPADLVKYQQCQAVGGVGMCGREVKKPVCDQSTDYKWKEGNEWDKSACTKADADEVKPKSCAAGTCGTITTTATCNATGEKNWAWTYTSDEATACTTKSDETETCSDGTVRTRKYTCENDKWVLGDWDKECPEEKETYTCQTGKDEGGFSCSGGRTFNSYASNKTLSTTNPESDFNSKCCICPSDKPRYNGSSCVACAKGTNWNGSRCESVFVATRTEKHVSFGGYGGATTYYWSGGNSTVSSPVYHMATTEWCFRCNATINAPNQLDRCSGNVQAMCDNYCDATQSTCLVGCYDGTPADGNEAWEYGFSATSGGGSYAENKCRITCTGAGGSEVTYTGYPSEAPAGYMCSNAGCGGDTTYASHSCSSCGGISKAGDTTTTQEKTYTNNQGQKVTEKASSSTSSYVPKVHYVTGYTCGSMTAKGQCSGYGYY